MLPYSVWFRFKPNRFKPVFLAKIKNRYLDKKNDIFGFFGFGFFSSIFPHFWNLFFNFPLISAFCLQFFTNFSLFLFCNFSTIVYPFFGGFWMGTFLHNSNAIKVWITHGCIAILTTCWPRRAEKKHSWSIQWGYIKTL